MSPEQSPVQAKPLASQMPLSERLGLLSNREREVLQLLVQGLRRAEVAAALFRSPKTIDKHCSRIYHKLGVHSQAQLMALITNPASSMAFDPDAPRAAQDPSSQLEDRVARAMLAIERRLLRNPPEQYFRHLVVGLSEESGVQMAGISEYDHADREIVILVATEDGEPMGQLVCDMDTSACGNAYEQGECVCERDARTAFPESEAFRIAKVDSYAGVRLETRATGPVGCLWVANREPIEDLPFVLDLLRVFRPRVSSELALQVAIDHVEELGGSIGLRPLLQAMD